MRFLSALAIFTICGNFVFAQDIQTLAYYGRDGDEQINGLAFMPNGNVLAAGIQSSGSTPTIYDFYAFEVGPDSVLWAHSYGGSETDWVHDVTPALDGGYLLVGYTRSTDGDVTTPLHGESDVWLVKISETGDLEWSQTYGSSGDDEARAVIVHDGAYFIAGFSSAADGDVSASNGLKDAWLLKIDVDGTLVWEQSYGGSSYDEAFDLIFDADIGQFVVVGKSSSSDGDLDSNNGGSDVWIMRLDTDGNLLWQNSFGGSNADSGLSVAETGDGGYAIMASTVSNDGDVGPGIGAGDSWLVRLNDSGNIQWSRVIGGPADDNAREVMLDAMDGNLIALDMIFLPIGAFDTHLTKLDVDNGNVLWDRLFGGSQFDFSNTMLQNPDDGSIILGGFSDSILEELGGDVNRLAMHGVHQAWVWKYSNPPVGVETVPSTAGLQLYPNPMTDGMVDISLDVGTKGAGNWQCQIYDAQGALQITAKLSCPMGKCTSSINVNGLGRGMYFFKLQSEQGDVLTKKLLKY